MILVTGGSGLLGGYLIADQLRRGYQVRGVKRKSSNLQFVNRYLDHAFGKEVDQVKKRLEWVDADLGDIFSLIDILEGVDVVYHSAAMVGFNTVDQEQLYQVNVNGTQNLVNAMLLQYKSPILCHISSTAAVGSSDAGEVDETCLFSTDEPHSYYGYTKHLAELEVERARQEGLKVCILNPSVILGYTNPKTSSGQLFTKALNSFPFYTSGSNGVVYAKDVARAANHLVENELFEGRYLCVGGHLSFRDLQSKIARSFSKKGPTIQVPNFLMKTVGRIGDFTARLGLRTGMSQEIARSSINEVKFSSERLINSGNFEFSTVHEALTEIAHLYLETPNKRG